MPVHLIREAPAVGIVHFLEYVQKMVPFRLRTGKYEVGEAPRPPGCATGFWLLETEIWRWGPKVQLTLACGDYEIVRALKEGAVEPDGIDLNIVTDSGLDHACHWRFLRNNDFEVAEVSCSSYIAAKDQGMPVRGIPVFCIAGFATASSSSIRPREFVSRPI